MTDFKFACPHCNQHLESPPEMFGSVIACPSCNRQIQVPRPAPPSPLPPVIPTRSKTDVGDVAQANAPGNSGSNDQGAVRTMPMATWSLSASIVGMILTFVRLPLVGLFGSLLAVGWGHKARARIKRSTEPLAGRRSATAGLIVGYVGVLFQIGLLASVGLPYLSNVRQSACRNQCRDNMKQITMAAYLYHQANDKMKFPDDFQTLIAENPIAPKSLVCPATRHQPGNMTEVEKWTDYVLVAGRSDNDPSDTVLVFSKPECYGGKGGNVGFVDGSVRWCEREEYERLTRGAAR